MSSYLYTLYDTLNIRSSKVGINTENPLVDMHIEGTMMVDRITNQGSNVDFMYSTLSNVQLLHLDTLTTQTGSHINVDAKTLSNVNTLSVTNITSDIANINLSNKSLSNVLHVSLSNITSEQDTIYFDGKSLSNIDNLFVTENVRIGKNLYTSNLFVIGETTTLNTLTSNTEQMTVTNAGTGPALVVTQTGPEAVAAFYDGEVAHPALFIEDGGFVGIGTDDASSRLHVYDTGAVLATVETTASSTQAQIKLINGDGDTFVGPSADDYIEFKSTANQPMRIGTNSAENISIMTDGKVGIGSTDPQYLVDIGGDARIAGTVYQTTGSMNTITYAFGGEDLTDSNSFLGFNLSWSQTIPANQVGGNKLVFRVMVKCHLASDDSVAYRKFETLINPVNDSANGKPMQIVATEIADTSNNDFSNLLHTVTRTGDNAVDVKVTWSTSVASYVGNMQIEVFASTSLGDFTFTPIS
jgi:hypothetical protein